MASIKLLGRQFEIARYGLGALRKVAPHVDNLRKMDMAELNARVISQTATFAEMLEPTTDLIGIVHPGLEKLDPTLTMEYLLEEVGFSDLPNLTEAMQSILMEAGLQPDTGEKKAPSEQAPAPAEGASQNNSPELPAS